MALSIVGHSHYFDALVLLLITLIILFCNFLEKFYPAFSDLRYEARLEMSD
jgi:hypothetical protein